MAKAIGLEDQEVEFVRLGGILHDIGKIGFTDRIFQATDKKPPSDMMQEIMRHPQVGAEILGDLEFLGPALEYVRCHHERPDGKGYPGKLKDEDIPLGAKILAVADSFDAMTTNRPYQKALSVEDALDILNKQADAKWDGRCVAALEVVLRHGGRG
jgi:HD-GYP domain-containing protein (c-di-GMP phosphodiesterase class II)